MTTRQKVDTIYQQRKDLLTGLEAIRATCSHKETRIGNYGDVRRSSPANICVECDYKVSWVVEMNKIPTKQIKLTAVKKT